jgi:type II secretory pathway component PulM
MRTRLRKAWESRAPRERAIIAALAVVLGAALYAWLVQSAGRARVQLHTSVTTLRAQAVRLDEQALEYDRLRAAPAVSASQSDLLTLVQAQAGAAGLSRALVRIDAPDADRVVVVFGAVAFADWLGWIAGLKSQHARLDACRIEALSTPGLVSVTATLVRAKRQ